MNRTLAALSRISTLAFVAALWGRFGALGVAGLLGHNRQARSLGGATRGSADTSGTSSAFW